jgi:hypothetical protein
MKNTCHRWSCDLAEFNSPRLRMCGHLANPPEPWSWSALRWYSSSKLLTLCHKYSYKHIFIVFHYIKYIYTKYTWFSSSSVRLCQQIRQSRPSEKWQGCLSSWRVGSLLEVPCTRVCSWFRSPRTGCQFTGCHQPTKLTSAAAQMRPLRAPKCGHPSDRSLFSLGGNSLQRWTTWNLEWKFHTSVCVHASQSIISIFYYLCSIYIYT